MSTMPSLGDGITFASSSVALRRCNSIARASTKVLPWLALADTSTIGRPWSGTGAVDSETVWLGSHAARWGIVDSIACTGTYGYAV